MIAVRGSPWPVDLLSDFLKTYQKDGHILFPWVHSYRNRRCQLHEGFFGDHLDVSFRLPLNPSRLISRQRYDLLVLAKKRITLPSLTYLVLSLLRNQVIINVSDTKVARFFFWTALVPRYGLSYIEFFRLFP